ncbi:MAG: hypothetical protein LBI76_06495, partial [Comamonas sp.]|nr:hypothetical protein [Comamonas sp.]
QGANGELPAGCRLRRLVADADGAPARRALEEWERAPLIDDAELALADPSLAEQALAEPRHDPRFDLACDPHERASADRDGEQEAYSDARRWYPCWWAGAAALLALCLHYLLGGVPQPDAAGGAGVAEQAQKAADAASDKDEGQRAAPSGSR